MVEYDYHKRKGNLTYARLLGDAILKFIAMLEKGGC